jgi:putative ABC transport system permease protein
MSSIAAEIRQAVRALTRRPGFALAAIAALALGIGVNAAIFSVADAVLWKPMSYPNSGELVRIYESNPGKGFPQFSVSVDNFLDWRKQNASFTHVAAIDTEQLVLLQRGEPKTLSGLAVSPDLFPMLGVAPAAGRVFRQDEERPGSEAGVLLSWGLWRERFGGDPAIVGRRLDFDEGPRTVVGVMPETFRFGSRGADFWIPFVIEPDDIGERGSKFLGVVARRRPGVQIASAQADMDRIVAAITAAEPEKMTGWGARVEDLRKSVAGDVRRPLLLLFGSVAFVLLIACANVSNLLIARSVERRRETAVRVSLGAARGRLVRGAMAEVSLLAAAGAAAGFLLAFWTRDALVAFAGRDLPRSAEIAVGGRTLLFVIAAAAAATLISGLIPALRVSSTAATEALASTTRQGAGPQAARARRVLVVAQLALALMLVSGAGLLARSLAEVLRVEPGFRPDRVLTISVALPESRYEERDSRRAYFRQALARLSALPGVESTGIASFTPLAGEKWTLSFNFPHRPVPEPEQPDVEYRVVGGDFFRTVGIPLRSGRLFSSEDSATASPTVVVNEAFVARFLQEEDPLATRVRIGDGVKEPRAIVGVVGDVKEMGLAEPPAPIAYIPYEQVPWRYTTLLLRTTGEPRGLAAAARAAIAPIDPLLPIEEIGTLDDVVAASVGSRRFAATLIGLFASLALLLAAVGLYGVMAYAAAQRRREVGIRIALGARSTEVVRLFLGEGARLSLAGAAVGILLALAATRLLASQLYNVKPGDPLTLGVAAAVLIAVGVASAYLPARRASRVDPVVALRSE